MPPFQVTESTCSTKSFLDYFMFGDGGLGCRKQEGDAQKCIKGAVPSTQRKNLRCWGICRDGYERGCFPAAGECLEMDAFVVKALTPDGLEVVRNKG